MKAGRALIAIGAVLLMQALLLYRAFHYGAMAGLVPWDDCVTLQRGLHNLRFLFRGDSLWRLVELPGLFHTPIADVQTLIGFSLSSGQLWGPYALNGLLVLLVLWAVLVKAGRPGTWLFLALLVFLLVQPVTVGALTFLKADWKGALLIAAAIQLLYAAVEQDRRELKLWGAGLLGLGLVAKLTAFYMPALAVLLLLGFEALALAARPPARGELAARLGGVRRDLAPALALTLLPYLVLFAFSALGYHHLLAYIRYALSDTWSDGLDPWRRAGFYGPLAPGGGPWGRLHLFAGLFAAAALVVSLRARSKLYPLALLLLVVFAGLVFAPLVMARTSNWDFEASFLGVVIGLTLVSMRVVAAGLPRLGARLALAGALALGVGAPLDAPFLMPDVGRPSQAELKLLAERYGEVADELSARAHGGPLKLRLLYEHSFAPFPSLSYLYYRRTGELMDVDRIDSIAAPQAIQPDLASSDFLMTAVPASGRRMHGLPQRFPTSADPAGADALIAARPDFALARRFPVPDGEIRLYAKRR